MSLKIPKTGLAGRIRLWAADRERPFVLKQICDDLHIPPGDERKKAGSVINDFVKQGEVKKIRTAIKQNRRQNIYRYNQAWKRARKGTTGKKILKAMRLISFKENFAISDIKRVSGAPNRSYVEKITRKLLALGYIRKTGYRLCSNRRGRETLYRVTDPDKFRVDLLD